MRRAEDLIAQATQANDARLAAIASGDGERILETTDVFLRLLDDLSRTWLQAKDGAGSLDLGITERQIVQAMLETRQVALDNVPDALAIMVDVAVLDADGSATGREDRQRARALLVQHGFVSIHELESFPRESLKAIAVERFARWQETGDPRG